MTTGWVTACSPLSPCGSPLVGEGGIGGLRPPSSRTPMLCIGYGVAARRVRGCFRARISCSELADEDPSSGASRHLLPQGEKGKTARGLGFPHHRLQIIIRLDDLDQAVFGGAVAVVGVGVVLLHQRFVLGLDVGERGTGA